MGGIANAGRVAALLGGVLWVCGLGTFGGIALAQDPTLGSQWFPTNPNDLSQFFPEPEPEPQPSEPGSKAALRPGAGLQLRAKGRAVVDSFFDTGRVTSNDRFFPSTIVLDGTPAARSRGRFGMAASGSEIEIGLLGGDAVPGVKAATAFDFAGNELRLRHAYGSVPFGGRLVIVGGQTFTTFSDPKAMPTSIINDGTPAGAVFRRQPLLRWVVLHDHGFSHAVAIENPTSADFVLPDATNDTRLQRYPDLIARLRWDGDEATGAQLAALARGVGYEDLGGHEHLVPCWGVAATMVLRPNPCWKDCFQLGAVHGEGLGRYLFGFGAEDSMKTGGDMTAAGPDAFGRLAAVPATGAFVGYQHHWSSRVASQFAYGYSYADLTSAMPATIAKRSQNAWANLIIEVTSHLQLGVEYQYGALEVHDGTQGDDHRVQMTLSYSS